MLILSIFYLFGLGYHVGKSSWWRTDVPAPRTSQHIAEQTTSMVLGATAPVAHLFIILGSIFMLRLERIGWAKTAAILSAIPILSHCLIVGIPFGYWALSVLRKPEVKLLFAYHQVDKKNLNTNIAPSLALVSMLVCFVPGFLIGDLRWDSLRNSNKKSDTEPEPATRWPARAVPEEESMED